MDGFTFRADLPTLRAATRGSIIWSYLAEKVDTGATNTTGFSEEAFHQEIRDEVARDIRAGIAPRGIGRAVHQDLLGGAMWSEIYTTEGEARYAARDFQYDGYEFQDVDEWDFTSYTSDFERAVLGAQLVIHLYDQAQTADLAAA